ncbi:uncharacterized protein LOC122089544 [Macadamia integrifolia]|uniref:uncharacterized protein LOC122089544 n=1 Tax=Macadamia integrifolia TaxID=60698 RepID=UPI001C4F37B6|nr:uncharacterized protein LOC122089544 [Macadamia integrifolia]
MILSIPIPLMPTQDKFVWAVTANGSFSVASAYSIAMEGVAPKIQHLLWKTLHNRLPLPTLLNQRGFSFDVACSFCTNHALDPNHLFLSCSQSQQMWYLAGLGNIPAIGSIVDAIKAIITSFKASNRQIILKTALFCWIMWQIWTAVWDQIFRANSFNPQHSLLVAIREAKNISSEVKVSEATCCQYSLDPSPPGVWKFNVDGTSKGTQACRIAGVCRDHNNNFICCFSGGIGYNHALTAEALAARQALIYATKLQATSVVIESDNLLLICCLNGSINRYPWRIASINILADSIQVAGSLPHVVFQHFFRESTAVADKLASEAASSQSNMSIMFYPPTSISYLMYANYTGCIH